MKIAKALAWRIHKDTKVAIRIQWHYYFDDNWNVLISYWLPVEPKIEKKWEQNEGWEV